MENSHSFGLLDPKHSALLLKQEHYKLTIFNAVQLLFHGQVGSGVLTPLGLALLQIPRHTIQEAAFVPSTRVELFLPSLHHEAADQID
ncbi:hypothetical protein GYMLUDRAFT_49268 [Collybiopsis luxurians FD-317 M1]|uniref:Uncharacterized protein n=1 Tax=Collybiopsis luxurians FD-317 M1 TaxID=944289 RepID=A0A0D0BVE8_9AGAR|nr:hypothetical protein GYMLUDRAFT_49268 [Collybiopsis luxurians FD-317 M1]